MVKGMPSRVSCRPRTESDPPKLRFQKPWLDDGDLQTIILVVERAARIGLIPRTLK